MLTPGISDKMGVLDASIATGTDDKLSLIFNTLFEHHVCSHPTSMETYSQGKFLMEIVLIALKQKNQNKMSGIGIKMMISTAQKIYRL